MANNRMWLTDGVNKILLAKGWGLNSWEVPKSFTPELLESFLNAIDKVRVSGDCFTPFKIEYDV